MSDTLPEREDQKGWLECSSYESVKEVNEQEPERWISHFDGHHRKGEPCNQCDEHQPAARGGGEGDKWSIKVHGNEIDADLLVNGSYVGTLHADKAKQILTEHNQHQALVAERERLLEAIKEVAIPSLRYCEQKYDHDDQARLNLEALVESVEQRSTSDG